MSAPPQQFHALVCFGSVSQAEIERLLRALDDLDSMSVAGAWPVVRDDGATAYVVHLVHEAPGASAEQIEKMLSIASAASEVHPRIVRDVVGFAVTGMADQPPTP